MPLFLDADETMHGAKMVSRHGTIVWSVPSRSSASSSMERLLLVIMIQTNASPLQSDERWHAPDTTKTR